MWTTDECAKYYLCLDGDVFEFHCSPGLMFDVNRQLCDMQQNVHNCDLTMGMFFFLLKVGTLYLLIPFRHSE